MEKTIKGENEAMKNIVKDDKDLGMICLTILGGGIIAATWGGAIPVLVAAPAITGIVGVIGGAMRGNSNVIVKPPEPK